MTAPYMTSDFRLIKSRTFDNIFEVEVEDMDGESHSYEIAADSFAEAAQDAESLAYNDGIDISIMHIYLY